MNKRIVELVGELRGIICRCGKCKMSKQTFCPACYMSLPKPMQRALYRRIDDGYAEAYDAAVEHLTKAGGVRQ